MKLWQKIVVGLLYLTPVGFMLTSTSLLEGKNTSGIHVSLGVSSPARATVKPNPTIKDRVIWFGSGVILLVEACFIAVNEIGEDFGGAYAMIAFIFGVVSLISSLFPRFPWNRRLF